MNVFKKGLGSWVIVLLLVFCSGYVQAKNSFLVAPGRVDFDLSRPNTQSFIITNSGDDKIRLSIEPVYFEIDSRSLAAGEPLDKINPGKDDLRPYIRVSPRTLSLNPGQRRDIRISVRASQDMDAGDYRAHLLVRMLETARIEDVVSDDPAAIGMKLAIKLETAVAIYGYLGERQAELAVNCLRGERGDLLLDINNPTRWRFEGWFSVNSGQASEVAEPLARKHVNSLRESRRQVRMEWSPKSGEELGIIWRDAKTDVEKGRTQCKLSD